MIILHASDLQIGRPYRPGATEALLKLAAGLSPDLVVLSGDLTQRAKVKEYREAEKVLEALAPLPVVVTPGNHDVPLYRFWERLLAPYRNWRRFISKELDSVLHLEGGTVVALNSSAPRRAIVAGRLDASQLTFARRAFASAPEEGLRVLVTHHHFVGTKDGEGGRPLPGAAALLECFEEMGVDVILGGHVHQTHITTSRVLVDRAGPGVPIVACGTTASSRGRGPEAGINTLNVVNVGSAGVEVTPHRLDEDARAFVADDVLTFPRRPDSASVG